jgi:hypothetical protein
MVDGASLVHPTTMKPKFRGKRAYREFAAVLCPPEGEGPRILIPFSRTRHRMGRWGGPLA